MANTEKQNLIEGREIANLDSIMEALPEVQKEKNLWQNNFHEFDVYHHTVKFVEHLKKILDEENHEIDLNLIAAGWLHDIGKPTMAKPKKKNEDMGALTPEKILMAAYIRKQNEYNLINFGIERMPKAEDFSIN